MANQLKEFIIIGQNVKPQVFKEIEHQAFLKIKNLIKSNGAFKITVRGTSMMPLISDQDILHHIVPIQSIDSLKRFDVIIFWQNNILLCHYFWKKNSYFQSESLDPESIILTTRPLNPLNGRDHPITMFQVLGFIPNVKINLWLKTKILLTTYWQS